MPYFGKYDTPADLLADEHLNTDEKIRLLESWRNDKRAFMRASGEGMQGPSRSDTSNGRECPPFAAEEVAQVIRATARRALTQSKRRS